jgi:hypothetical protein
MNLIRECKAAIEESALTEQRIEEMSEYLYSTETPLGKFDALLFRGLVEKVVIYSLVEANFIFRS